MTPSHSQEITVDGHQIRITHPEKLLWPEQGITKALYLQKLAALAPYLLKYCRNRYLTVIRFPDGVGGESFYQKKNAPKKTYLLSLKRQRRTGSVTYSWIRFPLFFGSAIWRHWNFIHLSSMWVEKSPRNGCLI